MQRYLGVMLICKVAVVDFPPRPPRTSVVLGACLGFPWKTFPLHTEKLSLYSEIIVVLTVYHENYFQKRGSIVEHNNQPNCRTTTNQIAECGAQFHGTHLGYNSHTSISEIIREESAMTIRARGISD